MEDSLLTAPKYVFVPSESACENCRSWAGPIDFPYRPHSRCKCKIIPVGKLPKTTCISSEYTTGTHEETTHDVVGREVENTTDRELTAHIYKEEAGRVSGGVKVKVELAEIDVRASLTLSERTGISVQLQPGESLEVDVVVEYETVSTQRRCYFVDDEGEWHHLYDEEDLEERFVKEKLRPHITKRGRQGG